MSAPVAQGIPCNPLVEGAKLTLGPGTAAEGGCRFVKR